MNYKFLAMLAGLIMAAGCVTKTYEPTEADMLNEQDNNMLVVYARHFLTGQNKTFKFTADELDIIKNTQPRIKASYTGYKTGRLSIGWDLPTKQAFAIANGKMLTTRDWMISIVRKGEVVYLKKKPGTPDLPPVTNKDFDDLRNK